MGIIAVDATQVDVGDTTVETTIFSATVPANTIQADKWVVLKILGNIQTDGSNTITVRVKFGGTTYYQDANSIGVITAQEPVWFYIPLAGNNATNAQTLGGGLFVGTDGGATTGIGDIGTDEIDAITPILNDGVAIDQTSAQALAVTMQWSIAFAGDTFSKYYGVIYDMTEVPPAVLPGKGLVVQWAVPRAATW